MAEEFVSEKTCWTFWTNDRGQVTVDSHRLSNPHWYITDTWLSREHAFGHTLIHFVVFR